MKIDFSRAAEADIAHINREGIRLFGVKQAQAYAQGLAHAFELLAEFPLANPERTYMRRPIRAHTYGAHVIIYAIKNDTVLVLRIRHGREDWQEE